MSYALMLFEELFASQLSVPSSPVHPIKCTTVQMKEKKKGKIQRENGNETREGREKRRWRDRENKKDDNDGEFRQHGEARSAWRDDAKKMKKIKEIQNEEIY